MSLESIGVSLPSEFDWLGPFENLTVTEEDKVYYAKFAPIIKSFLETKALDKDFKLLVSFFYRLLEKFDEYGILTEAAEGLQVTAILNEIYDEYKFFLEEHRILHFADTLHINALNAVNDAKNNVCAAEEAVELKSRRVRAKELMQRRLKMPFMRTVIDEEDKETQVPFKSKNGKTVYINLNDEIDQFLDEVERLRTETNQTFRPIVLANSFVSIFEFPCMDSSLINAIYEIYARDLTSKKYVHSLLLTVLDEAQKLRLQNIWANLDRHKGKIYWSGVNAFADIMHPKLRGRNKIQALLDGDFAGCEDLLPKEFHELVQSDQIKERGMGPEVLLQVLSDPVYRPTTETAWRKFMLARALLQCCYAETIMLAYYNEGEIEKGFKKLEERISKNFEYVNPDNLDKIEDEELREQVKRLYEINKRNADIYLIKVIVPGFQKEDYVTTLPLELPKPKSRSSVRRKIFAKDITHLVGQITDVYRLRVHLPNKLDEIEDEDEKLKIIDEYLRLGVASLMKVTGTDRIRGKEYDKYTFNGNSPNKYSVVEGKNDKPLKYHKLFLKQQTGEGDSDTTYGMSIDDSGLDPDGQNIFGVLAIEVQQVLKVKDDHDKYVSNQLKGIWRNFGLPPAKSFEDFTLDALEFFNSGLGGLSIRDRLSLTVSTPLRPDVWIGQLLLDIFTNPENRSMVKKMIRDDIKKHYDERSILSFLKFIEKPNPEYPIDQVLTFRKMYDVIKEGYSDGHERKLRMYVWVNRLSDLIRKLSEKEPNDMNESDVALLLNILTNPILSGVIKHALTGDPESIKRLKNIIRLKIKLHVNEERAFSSQKLSLTESDADMSRFKRHRFARYESSIEFIVKLLSTIDDYNKIAEKGFNKEANKMYNDFWKSVYPEHVGLDLTNE